MICQNCHASFEGGPSQKHCSGECRREWWTKQHPEQALAIKRANDRRPRKRNAEAATRALYKWLKSNRHKDRAQQRLRRAVKSGKIVKGPCRDCNSLQVEGHHPDYSKPLEVIWLCDRHHKDEHIRIREGNGYGSTEAAAVADLLEQIEERA